MKRIKKLFIILLLIIPVIITANTIKKTYSEAVTKANNYINGFPNKEKYIYINENIYGFNGTKAVKNTELKSGGLISSYEYQTSVSNNHSWLETGSEYWTQTQTSDGRAYIDAGINYKGDDNSSGVRVTEFVYPDVKVSGSGTASNPWQFVEQLTVRITKNRNDSSISVTPESQTVSIGDPAYVTITETARYMYTGRDDCNLTFSSNGATNYIKTYTVTPTQDINCVANFDVRRTIIKYNANGGIGTIVDAVYKYGENYTIANNTFTRVGYTFKNWNTKADGTGISYNTGSITTNIINPTNNIVTLYAIWNGNKYTIKFNANGGTGTTANVSCTYGTACTLTSNGFSRSGYAFQGWATSSTGAKVYDNGASVTNLTSTNNATVNLYAVWKDNSKPSPSVTKSNKTTSGLTATLKCSDNVGVTSYYWGTSAPTSSSTYTNVTSTTSMSIDKTVNAVGTYYLSCKDAVGNEKNTSVSVTKQKQKSTRTYNSCASGSPNACVGDWDYATKVNGTTCLTRGSCSPGWWSESYQVCLYETSNYYSRYNGRCSCQNVFDDTGGSYETYAVSNSEYSTCTGWCARYHGVGGYGNLTETRYYTCPTGWLARYGATSSTCYYMPGCDEWNKVCQSGYSDYGNATYCRKWNSCKYTQNTCSGAWSDWSGWTDDSGCTPSSTSSQQTQCQERFD